VKTSDSTTQQLLNNLDVTAFYIAHVPGLKVNGHVNAKCRCPFGCGSDLSFSVEIQRGLLPMLSVRREGIAVGVPRAEGLRPHGDSERPDGVPTRRERPGIRKTNVEGRHLARSSRRTTT
jgi:hypothetical protein